MPPKKAPVRPQVDTEKTTSTRSQSRNNVQSNGSTIQTVNDSFKLTAEEKKFLEELSGAVVAAASAATVNQLAWTGEQQPKLLKIVEKVLSVAATSYKTYYDEYLKKKRRSTSTTSNGTPTTTTPPPPTARVAPPAGTPSEFEEENQYLLTQLSLQQWTPFTIIRLCELLQSPAQHHLNKEGVLRGDSLQASIRRCVLVLYPFDVRAETATSG